MRASCSPDPLCVAVVGVGFSGAALAIQLLRSLPRGSRLYLLEPSPRRARGLAYATRCASHWLNVPAGRLGLDPADEAGFVAWLQQRYGACSAADFVPRMLLGDYLADALAGAERQARARGVDVQTLAAEVRALEPADAAAGRWRLRCASGDSLLADRVVLATGHLAPRSPRLPGAPAWGEPGMIDQPWDDATLAHLPEDGDLLLLGTGLSAIDLLTWLQDRGHAGRVTMLSRRGLLPQPHRLTEARPCAGLAPVQALDEAAGPRAMLRVVRRWMADAEAAGGDWREVMASLREATPALWQRLSPTQRRQFLRHLQPWWDTRRHRLAPGIQHRLQAALRTGQAEVAAGRLQSIRRTGDGALHVAWRPRGGAAGERVERRVAAVVNCTGPSAEVGHAVSTPAGGLLASLQAAGRLRVDPLGLGLEVDPHHRLLDRQGRPQPGLYYVGPMLKAQHWEAIAIPELRVHACHAARHLLAPLPQGAPA